ncbi:MAG: helix-turn-helix transcriptional regulator, partial [Victivallales bacterium]
EEDIDRSSVAGRFNLNPSYLSQLFTRMSGRSFHAYLTERRMEHAKHLLENSDLSVKQISAQCGFRSYVHFVRRFRELVKLSPGRYRENRGRY